MQASVEPLTDAQVQWLQVQLDAARQFLTDYGSERVQAGVDRLDHAWASWLDRQSVNPADPRPVINAVGVYFGQTLVDNIAGFSWVQATDPTGTSIAVHGLPGTADILIYPADLVSRRYETKTQVFLRASYDEISRRVDEINQRAGSADGG